MQNERGNTVPTTPSPLRYPGGKTKLYEYVHNILMINGMIGETYIEPFAGGAGLALKLLLNNDVKRIVINDFDTAIYSFWNCVLHQTDKLCNFVLNVPLTLDEWDKQHYVYAHQTEYSQIEIAESVLFLNRTNVSGVITGGMIGGRAQTGKYKIDARLNRNRIVEKINRISTVSDRIELFNLDAIDFLDQVLPHYYKVFINFDPPYVEKGGQLYKNFFTEDNHKILKKHISKCKRKWIVTYDVCDLISNLYSKFNGGMIDIYYSANGAKNAKEYIFFSKGLIIPENTERIT